jgi:hypothetical protein
LTGTTLARQERLHRRGLWLEWFTVAWNVVEAVVAIGVGFVLGSVSLVGFGVDSGIEVISAVTLLWAGTASWGAACIYIVVNRVDAFIPVSSATATLL